MIIHPSAIGRTKLYGRLKLGQRHCVDAKSFQENDLSCEIVIVSNNNNLLNNSNLYSSSYSQSDHYVILNTSTDQNTRTSPFLIALSILLGTCIVLFLAFIVHWLVNYYYRQKSSSRFRRSRHSSNSGAEEVNHDWIFLDRNSLEMPMKQQQQQPPEQLQQQKPPSVHSSNLHITSNPIINSSTLQQQKDLSDLTHSQMIAYFENLKESHA